MKLQFLNIALSFDHLRHPLTKPASKDVKSTKLWKAALTGLLYLAAIPLGLFYLGAAAWKNREVKKMSKPKGAAKKADEAAYRVKPENKFLERPANEVLDEFMSFLRGTLNQEGIFRVPGSVSKMQEMQREGNIVEGSTANDVATVLKRYITELKLIDGDAKGNFLSITAAGKKDEEKIRILKKIIGDLKDDKSEILKTVINFLGDLFEAQKALEEGKRLDMVGAARMSSQILVNFEGVPLEKLLEETKMANIATQFLIEHRDEIFAE